MISKHNYQKIKKKEKEKKNENIPDKILYKVKGSLVQLSEVLSHLDFTCRIELVVVLRLEGAGPTIIIIFKAGM